MTSYNERRLILLDSFIQKIKGAKEKLKTEPLLIQFKITSEVLNLLDSLERLNNQNQEKENL